MPEDVKYWRELARNCVPPINHAVDVFIQIIGSIKGIRNARKERLARRLAIFTDAAKTVVEAGKYFLGA